MDPSEPHWRMNSSFSLPPSARWDSRFQSDISPHGTHEPPVFGPSFQTHSRGSGSDATNNQYPNHQHSVSDGALPYYGSPSDSFQAPHWMPPVQRYDLGEFSTPAGGAMPNARVLSLHSEKPFPFRTGVSSMPNSLGSASSPSESTRWASSSKQPICLPPRNSSGRRSFMSKPVYPLVFRNPVSDGDPNTSSRMTPIGSSRSLPLCPESTFSPDFKFHKTLRELEKRDAFPEPGASFRREGFRWSNASSYDFGFDGDTIDTIEDHIIPENLRSPYNSARYQKCGLCERLLSQKSPWCSTRIVRNGDMPIVGVLPCRHVFHAECLEETTIKSQAHEPPCPLCLKRVSSERSISFSEPLQVALRSARRNGLGVASSGAGTSSSPNFNQSGDSLKRNRSLTVAQRGCSLIKDHFRKRFSFKGKVGKDLFGVKILGRAGSASTSSSLLLPDDHHRSGRLRT